jgi:hypothetical protein
MERDVLRDDEALNTFWDDLVLGRAPTAPDGIAGDAVDLVERLHALGEPPARDSARERVWRDLRQHRRWKETDVKSHSLSGKSIAGSPVPSGPLPWAPPARPTFPMRWAPTPFATAVLVLLVLAGSVLPFGPGLPGQQDDTPLLLPAMSGTPAAETVVTETLVDVPIDDLPTGTGTAGVVRWTLQPGPQPLLFAAQTGPRFFVVEAGEVTATEAGVEHRIAAGDVYVAADPEKEVAIHVRGPETVSLLRGYVSNAQREATRDLGAHEDTWLIEGSSTALPGGSGRLVLEQLTLPPGSALPPLETRALDWFEVGEGTLGVMLEGNDLPVGWPSGEERMFRVGTTTTAPIPPGTRMTLRNAGEGPLILYRLTLTPSDADTPGAGTPVP